MAYYVSFRVKIIYFSSEPIFIGVLSIFKEEQTTL